ncbi:PD-(D/E)XK nuclease family protein [Shewanella sp. 5_MG-2023]|uniref:PD-(D/E)XK nuclease family protein n=1 Tax=Shewanella sp. 5_MG-2023 TaxID=3062656 RepID=UPI0026E3E9D3|nr:PD-(D/E)XK nuclease family protein [Shewanella sp. 5_MG-2023]MDO6642154.1 PD-(D/E)XK nuclease family protein [Shewanella sp. 5_MG-2023]
MEPLYLKLKSDLNNFFQDPNYLAFYQRFKAVTYLDGYVDFDENRKSGILQWLLSPREGHLQQDYFIKALLAAYYRNSTPEQVAGLPQAYELSVKSFKQVTLMQELVITNNKRIDLLLADAATKTLILIERKDGSKAHTGQLPAYFDWAETHYPNWQRYYILSDSHKQNHGEQMHHAFVQLDDEWIVTAIKRLLELEALPARQEGILKDIQAYVFGEWDEQTEKSDKDLTKYAKLLAHNHASLLETLANESVTVNGKKIRLIDVSPATYFNTIALEQNIHNDSELNELLLILQASHDVLDCVQDYSSFEHLADEIKRIYPEITIEVNSESVYFLLSRHYTSNNEVDFMPYYFDLVKHTDKETNADYYTINWVTQRYCNEADVKYAEAFAEKAQMKVRSNWQSKTIEKINKDDGIDKLDITPNSRIRIEIDKFLKLARSI